MRWWKSRRGLPIQIFVKQFRKKFRVVVCKTRKRRHNCNIVVILYFERYAISSDPTIPPYAQSYRGPGLPVDQSQLQITFLCYCFYLLFLSRFWMQLEPVPPNLKLRDFQTKWKAPISSILRKSCLENRDRAKSCPGQPR